MPPDVDVSCCISALISVLAQKCCRSGSFLTHVFFQSSLLFVFFSGCIEWCIVDRFLAEQSVFTVRSSPNDENVSLVSLSECLQCGHMSQHETDYKTVPRVFTCYCFMVIFLDAMNDAWQGALVISSPETAWKVLNLMLRTDTVFCFSMFFYSEMIPPSFCSPT